MTYKVDGAKTGGEKGAGALEVLGSKELTHFVKLFFATARSYISLASHIPPCEALVRPKLQGVVNVVIRPPQGSINLMPSRGDRTTARQLYESHT